MADNKNDSFFKNLTRLFSSGPAVHKKIRGYDDRSYYGSQLVRSNYGYRTSAPNGFGRQNSPYSTMGAYGILDRIARYAEYGNMEHTPEIASALDIYADEVVGGDDRRHSFHVYSKNAAIQNSLEELFYDIINIEFNLRPWARNLVKYGDFFLLNEVSPQHGVIAVSPIPVNELERQEYYDVSDPYAVRFKWITRGNRYLENWQISHMRLLGNDLFLPYGSSVLESARRTWNQLTMMEDAMLVYRVVRSPDRRVFYVDVGNMAPNDIPSYMEAAKSTLRSNSIVDKQTGRMDHRYNPLSVEDDFFIPVRGTQATTKIETLAGGTNATAVEDVEYLQGKLFAALKVPKAYLNYVDSPGASRTLSQEDVRFSRSISMIQKVVIAELNKLAMMHLFSKGFGGEDIVDFELKLSNPSSVALQQKLELWTKKFDTATAAMGSELVDRKWVQKNILELKDTELPLIYDGKIQDVLRQKELEAVQPHSTDHNKPNFKTDFSSAGAVGDFPGSSAKKKEEDSVFANGKSQTVKKTFGLNSKENEDDESLEIDIEIEDDVQKTSEEKPYVFNYFNPQSPIKAAMTPQLARNKKNRVRRVSSVADRRTTGVTDVAGALKRYGTDIVGGTNPNKTLSEMFEEHSKEGLINDKQKSEILEEIKENDVQIEPAFSNEMKSIFSKYKKYHEKNAKFQSIELLKEGNKYGEEYLNCPIDVELEDLDFGE